MTKREKKTKAANADKAPATFEQQKAARATDALNAPTAPQK